MIMVEVKTTKLVGPALRYAVAAAEGLEEELRWCFEEDGSFGNIWTDDHGAYWPDELWEIGGPLIEKYNVWLSPPTECEPAGWDADVYAEDGSEGVGVRLAEGCPTALIAACRAIVAAKLGPVVGVPEELVQGLKP